MSTASNRLCEKRHGKLDSRLEEKRLENCRQTTGEKRRTVAAARPTSRPPPNILARVEGSTAITPAQTVREQYTEDLLGRGDLTKEDAEKIARDFHDQMESVFK